MINHVVQIGDTLESIASQYNTTSTRLSKDNNIPPNYTLNIGQAIMIVPPSQTHIVKEGDTINSISETYGTTVLQIFRNNPQLSDRKNLLVGEELVISYPQNRDIDVIGYSTTFISEPILIKTLPFLTYLFILNYKVNSLGNISDLDDQNIIRLAHDYCVAPIMFVSAMTETGRGSYATTHAIITNMDVQNQFIENALIMIKSKGFAGINLAFYSILPEDLPLYVELVSRITNRFNQEGFEVFLTLTPQTTGYKTGIPYDKTYFADFGRATNKVILITYLWQHGFIPQLSQTTVSFYKEYLDFVITQIPADKIYIGISRIAYDWEIPYVEGETEGVALTNASALNLANQLGSTILYDEVTQTPYFYYVSLGVDHFVWFKDSRSINSLLNLVDYYGLAGVAVWNIMYYNSQTWLSINAQYDINTNIECEP
ncbi:MAG: Peptidoglycan-binding lysin domain protein [Herbinix sp.]|jgi:spore germination protein|nr:Peptidoglycan-binding lysin domain protein [Herbinix sp.]